MKRQMTVREMKMRRKMIIQFASIIIFITALVLGLILSGLNDLAMPDKDEVKKYFDRDKKEFVIIMEYLSKAPGSSIYIDEPGEYMRISYSNEKFVGFENEKIEDKAVIKAINWLFKRRGYKKINKEGYTIDFQRWSGVIDVTIGIAYSISEKDEPVLQYLTKLEPLSEDGWYYYEEDYNEWRVRKRS